MKKVSRCFNIGSFIGTMFLCSLLIHANPKPDFDSAPLGPVTLPPTNTEAGQWLSLIYASLAGCCSGSAIDSIWHIPGVDSIAVKNVSGNIYEILDSIGGGGSTPGNVIDSIWHIPGVDSIAVKNVSGNIYEVLDSVGASSGGTVTSVGLSSTNSTLTIESTPVTTSGTITADINLSHANTWLANQTYGSGILNATSPNITTGVNDINGNPMITFSPVASAVNNFRWSNDATTNHSIWQMATGSSANITANYGGKGTGRFTVVDGTDTTRKLSIDPSGNTTAITGTIATAFTTAKTQTFPDNTGTVANLNLAQNWTAGQFINVQNTSSNTFVVGATAAAYKTTNAGGALNFEVGFYPNGKASGVLGWGFDVTQNGFVFGAGNSGSNTMIARASLQLGNLVNTAAGETGSLDIYTKGANQAMYLVARHDTDGGMFLNKYTTGTSFTGSPLALLSVNSSGKVIEEANGQMVGTGTNDNANPGNIGEYVVSTINAPAVVPLTSATTSNLTSISLTSGDWDVDGLINFSESVSTVTARSGQISITSATIATDGTDGNCGVQSSVTTEINSITLPKKRISIMAGPSTTVYLCAQATFSSGTCKVYGTISARRVR